MDMNTEGKMLHAVREIVIQMGMRGLVHSREEEACLDFIWIEMEVGCRLMSDRSDLYLENHPGVYGGGQSATQEESERSGRSWFNILGKS